MKQFGLLAFAYTLMGLAVVSNVQTVPSGLRGLLGGLARRLAGSWLRRNGDKSEVTAPADGSEQGSSQSSPNGLEVAEAVVGGGSGGGGWDQGGVALSIESQSDVIAALLRTALTIPLDGVAVGELVAAVVFTGADWKVVRAYSDRLRAALADPSWRGRVEPGVVNTLFVLHRGDGRRIAVGPMPCLPGGNPLRGCQVAFFAIDLSLREGRGQIREEAKQRLVKGGIEWKGLVTLDRETARSASGLDLHTFPLAKGDDVQVLASHVKHSGKVGRVHELRDGGQTVLVDASKGSLVQAFEVSRADVVPLVQ